MIIPMIHCYRQGGYNIVLDVNSGAVHSVDDIIFDILRDCNTPDDIERLKAETWGGPGHEIPDRGLDKYGADELSEALDEIGQLIGMGTLFSGDVFSDDNFSDKLSGPSDENIVKALCLHVAHDCNLRCRYCFAGGGKYHGERGLMSPEVGAAAIDFLLAASGNRRRLEVDFFGGEPLLNFGAVRTITEYGKARAASLGKEIRFTLTTNGVLLDGEKERFINSEMHNVVLSLDGRRAVNDRMRSNRAGAGSYDMIKDKFLRLAAAREGSGNKNKSQNKSYYVRGTFTRENLDFGSDVMHLAQLGFRHVSVEPVVSPEGADYAILEQDLPRVFAEYEALAQKLLELRGTEDEFDFFHFMIDLEGGPCVYKRAAGCGAGGEYLAVAPDGALYPCHQFVGRDDFVMGDVFGGVTDLKLRAQFRSANVYTKPACLACFAKFYCSGGCAASSYFINGDILKPYETGCEMQRKRTECAIMLKVADMINAGEGGLRPL